MGTDARLCIQMHRSSEQASERASEGGRGREGGKEGERERQGGGWGGRDSERHRADRAVTGYYIPTLKRQYIYIYIYGPFHEYTSIKRGGGGEGVGGCWKRDREREKQTDKETDREKDRQTETDIVRDCAHWQTRKRESIYII